MRRLRSGVVTTLFLLVIMIGAFTIAKVSAAPSRWYSGYTLTMCNSSSFGTCDPNFGFMGVAATIMMPKQYLSIYPQQVAYWTGLGTSDSSGKTIWLQSGYILEAFESQPRFYVELMNSTYYTMTFPSPANFDTPHTFQILLSHGYGSVWIDGVSVFSQTIGFSQGQAQAKSEATANDILQFGAEFTNLQFQTLSVNVPEGWQSWAWQGIPFYWSGYQVTVDSPYLISAFDATHFISSHGVSGGGCGQRCQLD